MNTVNQTNQTLYSTSLNTLPEKYNQDNKENTNSPSKNSNSNQSSATRDINLQNKSTSEKKKTLDENNLIITNFIDDDLKCSNAKDWKKMKKSTNQEKPTWKEDTYIKMLQYPYTLQILKDLLQIFLTQEDVLP